MPPNDIPLELWQEHKANIHQYYIIENKTSKDTMAIMRDVHGFSASKTQYGRKLAAWGFKKKNPASLYPNIGGSLKRKHVDLDSIQSVTISTLTGDRVVPLKKIKKALGRSNGSKAQLDPPTDAPSPLGLRIQYRPQNQRSDFDLHHYPCISLITELSNVLKVRQNFLSKGSVLQRTHNNQGVLLLKKTSIEMTQLLNISSIYGFSQLPSSFNQACKSLSTTRHRGLNLFFRAMFLVSNNQLGPEDSPKFREWLARNVDVGSLYRMQSWSAKALLKHLLHSAVEMDDITILRAAHTAGADLNSLSLFERKRSLLQKSLYCDSVQCARYLIDAGPNSSTPGSHQENTAEHVFSVSYSSTLLQIASRSHQCVELIPALLARGASPRGMLLLSTCVRSGATCDTIKALICAGVSPTEDGALSVATSLGRCDVMEVLLSAGAHVEGSNNLGLWPSIDGYWSPAVAAAESKCIEAIDLLIRHNVDLDASWLDDMSQDARENLQNHMSMNRSAIPFGESSFHPIQAAVGTGDCDFVKFMIRKGINPLPKYGHPLLVLAAQRADVAMMTFPLASGADVNMTSGTGPAVSALEAAASQGCLPGLRLLLDAGADLEFCSQRPGSRTPLQRAAEFQEIAAVELLLAKGADIKAPPCPVDGISTLQALIVCDRLELVIRALAVDASVDSLPGTIGSPLLTVIETGNIDLVSLLLRLGADVGRAAATGEPGSFEDIFLPLQLAAELGHLEICELLVNHGADVDGIVREDNEKTPLASACEQGHGSVVQYLITRNASLYGRTTFDADTPLYCAIDRQEVEIVQLLLENGVDANHFRSESGKYSCQKDGRKNSTPLIKACVGSGMMVHEGEEMAYDLAILLIKHGAKVNLRPSLHCNTPLQLACLRDDTKLAKLLLAHDADIDAPPRLTHVSYNRTGEDIGTVSMGFNALQAAISRENVEMVDLLLSRGANVHVAASSTMMFTALQAAATVGNVAIVERLLKADARVDEPPSKPSGRTAIQGAAEMGRLELVSFLLHHHKGTQIAEICDDAIVFAHRDHHDHVVGFLREYKKQHTPSPAMQRQEVVEIDDWINWEQAS